MKYIILLEKFQYRWCQVQVTILLPGVDAASDETHFILEQFQYRWCQVQVNLLISGVEAASDEIHYPAREIQEASDKIHSTEFNAEFAPIPPLTH